MFDLQPVTTANIISIAQIIVVVAGFYFSWKSLEAAKTSIGIAANNLQVAATSVNTASQNLKLATDNAQAQLYNQMLAQGRELQLRFMDIVVQTPPTASKEREEFMKKVRFSIGIIIAYYAGCFELRRVLSLPDSANRLLDNDIRESMRDETFRKRWDEIKHLYSQQFNQYVNSSIGVPA